MSTLSFASFILGCAATTTALQATPDFPDELVTFDPMGVEPVAVTPNFRASIRYEGGGHSVVLSRSQRADETSVWITTRDTYSTRYRMTSIADRLGGDQLYVAGIKTATGEDLIEKWEFGRPDGQYCIDIDYLELPFSMGVPYTPNLPRQVQIIGGGTFVPPDPEGRTVSPTRTVLATGDFGHVAAIEVDPEGRFLLFVSLEAQNVQLIDLTGQAPGAPTQIFDATEIQGIGDVREITAWDHATLGRTFLLTNGGDDASTQVVTFLHDNDNDGTFDAVVTVPETSLDGTPYEYSSQNWSNPVNVGVDVP